MLDVERKINELVDFVNNHEWVKGCYQPKKLEVKHDYADLFEEFHKYYGKDTQNVFCYTDKENEAIKIALRYAYHRYTKHGKDFMPKKFRPLFEELIKKL